MRIIIMNKYALCVSFELSFDASRAVINVKKWDTRLLNFRSVNSWLVGLLSNSSIAFHFSTAFCVTKLDSCCGNESTDFNCQAKTTLSS